MERKEVDPLDVFQALERPRFKLGKKGLAPTQLDYFGVFRFFVGFFFLVNHCRRNVTGSELRGNGRVCSV